MVRIRFRARIRVGAFFCTVYIFGILLLVHCFVRYIYTRYIVVWYIILYNLLYIRYIIVVLVHYFARSIIFSACCCRCIFVNGIFTFGVLLFGALFCTL
jgi:hypothetical protein